MSDAMTPEEKEWVDNASYETLLEKWRFSPVGSPIFAGEKGKYFSKIMFEKKEKSDHVAASKRVGW